MAYINTYKDLLSRQGFTQRERHVNYLHRDINQYAIANPAYKPITIGGNATYVIVNSQDDYKIKEIVSMPGQRIPFGSAVQFRDMPWIVTSVDIDDEINSKATMCLCNCKLKWKSQNGTIYTYDGYAEDATKYSEGVESTQYLRIAEFQIKVKIPVDQISALIHRDMRFVIDADKYIDNLVSVDDRPFVFRVTRRNIITGTYNDEGYVEITLVQDQWVEGKDDYVNLLAAQPYELAEPYPDTDPPAETDEDESGWM